MRERSQLVISLGEGAQGKKLRQAMDRAAKRAGLPVSVWARERLFDGLVRLGEIASDEVVTVRGVKS